MINGLGVLGYGVGGIEAEAVLLGQPLYQPMPRVVGVRLHGELPRTTTATDLVLVITEMLRSFGVVVIAMTARRIWSAWARTSAADFPGSAECPATLSHCHHPRQSLRGGAGIPPRAAKVGATAIRSGPSRRGTFDLMKQLRPDGSSRFPRCCSPWPPGGRDGDDLAAFAPRRAMLIGDAIRGQSLASNTLGRLLEEAWGGELFSTYGLTEAGSGVPRVPEHRGLHSTRTS